jgi:hypothetical protein
MDGWAKNLQSSFSGINLGESATKFAKGFNSSVQATKERFGQVAPDEITELPQGMCPTFVVTLSADGGAEYKDLEARVDALRNAHLAMLKYVSYWLAQELSL